jgi:hypothetical protein
MSDINSWMALHSAMQDDGRTRRPVDRDTWRRVLDFARPHRRTIATFLVLATVSAVLGVATPLLAGRAVDAIVEGGSRGRSWCSPCSSPSSRWSTPPSGWASG